MGLLDVFNSDEGRLGLGLLAAAVPRSDGAGFGQRLQEGIGSVDAWKQNKAKQAYLDMQMQEMKRKQDEEANGLKWREGLPAVMGNPQALQSYLLSPNSPFASKVLERQLFPKEAEPYTLGEGQVRFGPNNQQIAQGPAKVDKESLDPKIKQYEYAQKNGYKGTFEQFVTLGPTITAGAMAGLRDAQIGNIVQENAYNLPPPRPAAVAKPIPMRGQVKDGYRFKGGNPADKNNWEKQ